MYLIVVLTARNLTLAEPVKNRTDSLLLNSCRSRGRHPNLFSSWNHQWEAPPGSLSEALRTLSGDAFMASGTCHKAGGKSLAEKRTHRLSILKYEVIECIIKNRWLALLIGRSGKFYFVDFEYWNLHGRLNGPWFVLLSCRAQLVTLTLRCPTLQIDSRETTNQPFFLWVLFWTLL